MENTQPLDTDALYRELFTPLFRYVFVRTKDKEIAVVNNSVEKYKAKPTEEVVESIIQGIEANILDYDGNIDVTPDMVVHMNYTLVSLHPPCITAGTKEENTNAVIKAMDLFLGVPSVLMDNGIDRKKLYGKAGAFRSKPYGVEYRTLSNFWIFKPELIDWVWRNCERALGNLGAAAQASHVEECINNNDAKLAQALINEYNLEVI